jgi:site-specific DNA recombinase
MQNLGYIRVSTEEQALSGLGLAAQERMLRAYCEAKGIVLDNLLVDAGYSGKDLNRPGITELLRRVRECRVSTVITVKIDRLSRRVIDTLNVVETIRKHDAAIIFVQEAIDTTTAAGKAMLTVIAAFAEMERNYISERTRSALAAKKARGERLGNPPFGVLDGEDGVRQLARELRKQRLSLRAIGSALQERGLVPRRATTWSPEMVRRLLAQLA